MGFLHFACVAVIIVSSALSLFLIVYGLFGKEDSDSTVTNGMGNLIGIMSWFSILFIVLDYLIGEYSSVGQAIDSFMTNLFMMGIIRISLLLIAVLALAYLLFFNKTRTVAITSIKSIMRSSVIMVIICALLRWLFKA